MESPSGLLTVHVCTRCKSYLLETHGLTFAGRIHKMPAQFPDISGLLEGIGYTAAAKEVRALSARFAELE